MSDSMRQRLGRTNNQTNSSSFLNLINTIIYCALLKRLPGIERRAGHLKAAAILLENISHVIDEVESEGVLLVDFVFAAEFDDIGIMFGHRSVTHSTRRRCWERNRGKGNVSLMTSE